MYRKSDLQFLQDIYDRDTNDIALLYGSKDVGLAEIVSDFISDKECLYYKALAVDDGTQKRLFAAQLHDQTKNPIFPDEDYGHLVSTYINTHPDSAKKLIVLDNLKYLVRENPTFINYLTNLLSDEIKQGMVLFLLISDDIGWVENDMLKLIGKKSSEISRVIKLEGFSPSEFTAAFPDMPVGEAVAIYSVWGGKSLFYNEITNDTTFRSFLISQITKWIESDLDENMFLPREIREPSLYNTILVNLASGTGKLNDIHKATGIERAKLSVYLKTLIENKIVEKAVSADVGNSANTQKAVYQISDSMIRFYYRFLFPHISSALIMPAERFYRRYIEHGIFEFFEETYPLFCMEQIRWLEHEGRLNFKVSSIEKYYDKSRAIDFVIVAVGGSVIACACRYNGPHMSYRTYEDVKTSVRKNKIMCDNIWLFSASGFDQKLAMTGSVTLGLKLIEGKDQRLR